MAKPTHLYDNYMIDDYETANSTSMSSPFSSDELMLQGSASSYPRDNEAVFYNQPGAYPTLNGVHNQWQGYSGASPAVGSLGHPSHATAAVGSYSADPAWHFTSSQSSGVSVGPSFTQPAMAPITDANGYNMGLSGVAPMSHAPHFQPQAPDHLSMDAAGGSQSLGSSRKSKGSSVRKHAPRKIKQEEGLPYDTHPSSPPMNKSKLRSASRTSKNTRHDPTATPEERKSRECHNQVEKQYRNRLNAHFESLLEALPDSIGDEEGDGEQGELSPGGSGGGAGGGDRKVSKAEVLERARRHIKALERDCAALEGERDELRENVERLQTMFHHDGGRGRDRDLSQRPRGRG